jgi:hypothetical protein
MNLVIAGGRKFNDLPGLSAVVDAYIAEQKEGCNPVTVLCGMAPGADMCGHEYALRRKYAVWKFPANWDDHGKRAGHLRNELMAQQCSHVIVFWDGKSPGTKSMLAFAKQYNKPCKIVRYESQREVESKMADKVSGVIKVVKKNDFGFYSVKIDDTWYGTGQKKDPGVVAGDNVEGEYELEKGKYKTITKAGLTKAAKAAAPAAGSGQATTSSWAAKDDSIRYQSSRKDALTLLGLPGVLDSIVGKAKPADRQGLVEALVDKYTASYFEDVSTFGAVARANGTGAAADPAAPPADEEEE